MALTDTLYATLKIALTGTLKRAMGTGAHTGEDKIDHVKTQTYGDGSGSDQAVGWFSSKVTVTTGSTTISLADDADPMAGIGDDVPTGDPEATKLRAIIIENLDDINFVTLGLGTNALTSWLAGTNPTAKIPAGGFIAATFPAGLDAMNDGVDDEITLQADTASCIVKISYLFG